MTLALVTPPAVEPVSLAEAKRHLRVESDDEDAYLADLIVAARAHVEAVAGRKLATQVWRRYAAGRQPVPLLVGPVQRVEAVTVYDAHGHAAALEPADWTLWDECLALAPGVSAGNGVEIDVVAGYGDAPADVPPTLRRAILLLVAHGYEFRGAVAPDDQPVAIPPGFDALVAPHRRIAL